VTDHTPDPARIRAAQFVTAMSLVSYPAYPDPTTDTGWADVPAVMLLIDLTGREDIAYTAMMQGAALFADDLELRITGTDDHGVCVYLMTIDLGLAAALEIAGVADQAAVGMFAEAEMLLLSSIDQVHDDGAPVLAFAPNSPTEWKDRLVGSPSLN
jgi:hypothetical protein